MFGQLRTGVSRFRELFRDRARSADERDEEFAFHLEMETAENIRRGMSEAEARRAARIRFGATQRYRDETNAARGIVAVDHIARDTRLAFRRLHRAPAFSAGVIATLGVGIGAAVGIGSIVYGLLLRDLPYDEPERLMRVGFITEGLGIDSDLHSAATYYHFAKDTRTFSGLGTYYTGDRYALTDGDVPEGVTIASVTPSTLTLLGVRPLLGQLFEPGDSSYSNPREAILISENLWRRRYGADSLIVGRRIDIDHGARNIIGVLPRSFGFPSPAVDLIYPAPTPIGRPDINNRQTNVIGRLREGITREAAQAELNALIPGLSARFPEITSDMLEQSRARVAVTPLKAATVAAVRPQLVLLGVLVLVVLLIATTNVVTLFLFRSERAGQEIAIALSLGATKLALARRFVIEGIVLGLASTFVALPVAALVVSRKFGFTENELPRLHEVAFTWEAAAVVVATAMLIGGAVGLVAMMRMRTAGLFEGLRAARSTASRAGRRTQNGLVSFQVAVALMLLVATALLGRSFLNLAGAEIGFEPDDAMMFQVSLPWQTYRSYEEMATFYAKVSDRIAALPGVNAVGVSTRLPLAGRGVPTLTMQLQAGDDNSRPVVAAAGTVADAGYFGMMEIPLLRGRTFHSGDLHGAPATIISRRLAMSLFGTDDVVGRSVIRVSDGSPLSQFTITGVAGDVHWHRVEDGYVPTVYFPLLRDGDGLPADSNPVPLRPRSAQLAIRGTQLPAASAIHGILRELDPQVPATNIRTLGSLLTNATAHVRVTMLLLAFASAAALLLGVVGVYSVVSYAAASRVREFGIRIALGAAPGRVRGIVLRDGLRLVGIGTALGLIAAFGATRFLRALLYEVEPTSLTEFAVATVLLLLVTVVASVLPALRAARTSPAVVLRGE